MNLNNIVNWKPGTEELIVKDTIDFRFKNTETENYIV